MAEEAHGGLRRQPSAETLRFCREGGFAEVALGTIAGLDAVRRLHERAGFVPVHEALAATWGVTVTEQTSSLRLADGVVTAVAADDAHRFSKVSRGAIRLVEGLGVEGDAHAGVTVKHRSRVARDPTQPNLRQLHLIHAELHDELRAAGFDIAAAAMGENITTRGLDLLGLPRGARLHIGAGAVVQVTGLRNPCRQLDEYRPGLMAATLDRGADGNLIRKAGVMAVVLQGGEVRPGDAIRVELPPMPHAPLEPV